jgi:AcrR family transcriptional regulator
VTADLSVRDVVELSQRSLRSFYESFDGKDDLLLAIYEEATFTGLTRQTATMTLDQYGHLFPDDLDDVADKMDDLASGCAQKVPTKEAGQSENTL